MKKSKTIIMLLMFVYFIIPSVVKASGEIIFDSTVCTTREEQDAKYEDCTMKIKSTDGTVITGFSGTFTLNNLTLESVNDLGTWTHTNEELKYKFVSSKPIKDETSDVIKITFKAVDKAQDCSATFKSEGMESNPPKCQIVDDAYYGSNGEEVSKEIYESQCNPKCKVENDKYYDSTGKEVDKDTYNASCNPKCRVENNKYYDDQGNEVDEKTYNSKCSPKCKEDGDTYYDKNGNKVSKEAYLESCGLVENPKTGSIIPPFLIFIVAIVTGLYFVLKTKNKMFKI